MNADPANIILAAVGVVGLLGSGGIAMISVGRHGQRLSDLEKAREEDRETSAAVIHDLKARLEKAETTATSVAGLAQAIENMSERFTSELKHLVEKVGMEMGFMRSQVDDLKSDVRRRGATARQRTKQQGA